MGTETDGCHLCALSLPFSSPKVTFFLSFSSVFPAITTNSLRFAPASVHYLFFFFFFSSPGQAQAPALHSPSASFQLVGAPSLCYAPATHQYLREWRFYKPLVPQFYILCQVFVAAAIFHWYKGERLEEGELLRHIKT